MSKSEPTPLLHVTSEDSGVLITVFDRTFSQLAEGIDEVKLHVAPGLYEARFEAGSSVREQLLTVEPGEPVHHVHEQQIAFATPAPLLHTRSGNSEHGQAARKISREVHRRLGKGGQLMVFVRDLDLRGRTIPAQGLSLYGPAGQHLDLSADSLHGGGADAGYPPWAGCTYQLNPGHWVVRATAATGGVVEQTIVVCKGWQTQLFLERGRARLGGRARRPDLADAAVLMAKNGSGFDPQLRDLRAAELARQGLRDRRLAIDAGQLETMLAGKPRNPMLAIYGAHLLVRSAHPDKRLIGRVARNLRSLMGDHPDLRAIELWLGEREVGDFAEPPMLKSSWSIIVKASGQRSELVPRGSRSADVAETIVGGGPWLRWRVPRKSEPAIASLSPEQPLGRAIAEVAAVLSGDPREVLKQASEATPVEASVIALAQETGDDAAQISDADVLGSLRVPRTVAEDKVGAVLERLGV
jgi:hypothetical protein